MIGGGNSARDVRAAIERRQQREATLRRAVLAVQAVERAHLQTLIEAAGAGLLLAHTQAAEVVLPPTICPPAPARTVQALTLSLSGHLPAACLEEFQTLANTWRAKLQAALEAKPADKGGHLDAE